jgi:hypothetical protein
LVYDLALGLDTLDKQKWPERIGGHAHSFNKDDYVELYVNYESTWSGTQEDRVKKEHSDGAVNFYYGDVTHFETLRVV